MLLIVGLGNPEEQYSKTRHNMGFDVVNKLAEKYGISVDKYKFEGICGTGNIFDKKVMLVKPQTYMNLSGEAVVQFLDFYKINPEDLLVIYDDIDVNTGTIKIRKKGSAGSHNGMKSVVYELGTENFSRIRVGTGKAEKIDNLIDYVIKQVDDETYKELENGIDKAVQAVEEIIKSGIDIAMNKFN